MELFIVEAIDTEGNKVKKVFEANDENYLVSILDFLGLTPLKIKKLPPYFKYLNIKRFFKKIKKREIIEVLDNLHLIVRSGLPLNTGLLDLAQDIENPAIKNMLIDVAFQIQNGIMLSDAIKKYEKVLTPIVVSLFKIGEETGTLDETLKNASEHLRKIEDLKSKAKQALIYPAFAFSASFGAMIFWLVYVLPKIVESFKNFNMELPFATRAVIAISEFTKNYILFIIVSFVLFFVVFILLRKKVPKFKFYTDKIFLKLPVIGVIMSNFNYAFFAEYIKLMIAAGLPLYQTLDIMEEAIKNSVFQKAIRNTRELIEVGESFSDALKEQNIFAPLLIRMISVGEQTGALEQQLFYIADYFYKKVDYISQNIAKMIEPIVIGFVGGFMAIIMIALMGPIYSLVSSIGQM